MNKSLTPPKRSVSSKINPGSHQRSSASKKPIKIENNMMNVEEKLKNNRQKLTHTLDTYTMLIMSKNPIRCLQHNSVISIFCETENKLLCTNCVFGKNQHKFHKISPIDKSYEKVKQSIDNLQESVSKQIGVLSNIKHIVLDNIDNQTLEMHKAMQILTIKFEQAHRLLDQVFFLSKNKLIQTLQLIRIRHQTVAFQLNYLKDIYNIQVPMIKALEIDKIDNKNLLLYQHSLLYTLARQKKFEGNVWNEPKYEIRSLGQYCLNKINKIVEQLKLSCIQKSHQ